MKGLRSIAQYAVQKELDPFEGLLLLSVKGHPIAMHVYSRYPKTVYEVVGDTYEIRDILHTAGFEWSEEDRVWRLAQGIRDPHAATLLNATSIKLYQNISLASEISEHYMRELEASRANSRRRNAAPYAFYLAILNSYMVWHDESLSDGNADILTTTLGKEFDDVRSYFVWRSFGTISELPSDEMVARVRNILHS